MTDKMHIGEVKAYRGWLLLPELRLHSIWAPAEWMPGTPMSGNLDAIHQFRISYYSPPNIVEGGVYAWKQERLSYDYTNSLILWDGMTKRGVAFINGTVELYGNIAEHEHGYRAEHAVITSLDCIRQIAAGPDPIDAWNSLRQLRERYHVE